MTDDRTKVTGVWAYQSTKGNGFWAGTIPADRVDSVIEALQEGRTRILMFENAKEKETQPDFDLLLTTPRPRKE